MEAIGSTLFIFLGMALGVSCTYVFLRQRIKRVFLDIRSHQRLLAVELESVMAEREKLTRHVKALQKALARHALKQKTSLPSGPEEPAATSPPTQPVRRKKRIRRASWRQQKPG